MKVYVVQYLYYDDSSIFGIFSTEEKAQECKNKINEIDREYTHIFDYVLDEEIK